MFFARGRLQLFVLLLAQSFCLSVITTTSLPAAQQTTLQSHQVVAVAAALNEGTNDQQQQQLVLQLALVSARGSLAFWRPTDELTTSSGEASSAAAAAAAHNSRPTSQQINSNSNNNHSKCPQLSSSSSSNHIKATHSAAELLAVEGSSLKLNFVIVGLLKQSNAKQQQQQQQQHYQQQQQQQQQQLAGSKLSFRWTKNGQPLPVVSHNQQQQQQTLSKQRTIQVGQFGQRSASSQFSELIINENDIIRRYFANLPASSLAAHQNNSPTIRYAGEEDLSNLEFGGHSGQMPFVLAPHFDERQLGRLKFDAQLDSLLKLQQKLIKWHHHPATSGGSSSSSSGSSRSAQQTNQSPIDDFLADAQLIDWQKLELYLKQNAHQLRLSLAADDTPTQRKECQAAAIEQITIVQLDTSRLSLHEAGLYSLEACAATGQPAPRCQSVHFRLHVAQDWPILERTFEHQILDVGDRLSIKCEATGFTLPQITWFLDGQQLNEHKSDRHQQLGSGAAAMATAAAADEDEMMMAVIATNNLRVGDYVSQDNHVHSFVNSSRLSLTDGGLYRCQANNGFHLVEHEARVDVRGPASFARQLSNQSLLLSAETQLRVQCPFSGYPITSIEWFFKQSLPAAAAAASSSSKLLDGASSSSSSSASSAASMQVQQPVESFAAADETEYLVPGFNTAGGRSKRLSDGAPLARKTSNLDEDREPELEHDEWLSQAGMVTPAEPQPAPEDYPLDSLLPADYMPPGSFVDDDLVSSGDLLDYGDLQMDMQQQQQQQQQPQSQQSVLDRRRRDLANDKMEGEEDDHHQWIKLPQSRRHQVHLNGTLIVQELNRYDQGFYKCRVGNPSASSGSGSGSSSRLISSNEFHLSILVPPVISPFSSAETLREGMRNFLTCSVIEGDSPIRLSWLKDNQPIEDYIASRELPQITTTTTTTTADGDQQLAAAAAAAVAVAIGQQQQQQQQQTSRISRIRVETSNEYTSTLYFSHVDFRDNGNYTCMATNKAASVNYTARMLVNVPPKWVRAPKDCEFTAGQNVVIDCQAKAYPSARVWWEIGIPASSSGNPPETTSTNKSTKATTTNHQHQHPPLHYRTIISNSRIHILENASLVIRDLQPSDQGHYLCQASNNFGSLSSLIKLTVNVGASFTSKYLLKYAKLGERVELDCDPNGQSPLEINWFWRHQHQSLAAASSSSSSSSSSTTLEISQHKNTNSSLGQRLYAAGQPSELADIHAEASLAAMAAKVSFESPAGESVKLIIGSVGRQHSAEFICRASNRYGSDEKLFKLLVQEAPDLVRDLQPVQVESRSISISWPMPYTGNTPITGYTVEWAQQVAVPSTPARWSHVQVQQPAVTITGLSPLTSYEIKVRAHNQLGHSPDSSPLIVTTGEEAPTIPPSDIRAVPLSSSSIQLSWLAPPAPPPSTTVVDGKPGAVGQPSIKGYYLGYRMANSSTSASSGSDSFVFKTVPLSESSASASTTTQLVHLNGEESIIQQEAHNKTTDSVGAQKRVRVVIDDLKRATKYSIIVQAFNSAGPGPQSDPIESRTLLDDPPPMPMLRVGSVTFTSIELQWNFLTSGHHYHYLSEYISETTRVTNSNNNNNNSSQNEDNTEAKILIEGFQLYYRSTTQSGQQQSGGWLEKKIKPETHSMLGSANHDLSIVPLIDPSQKPTAGSGGGSSSHHHVGWPREGINSQLTTMRFILDQLVCGNSYQIYLVAYNAIGSGQPSQIVRTRTRGSVPIAPRKQDFLVPNSTLALLNLDTWADGGCSISNFEIRYKQRDTSSTSSSSSSSSSSTSSRGQPAPLVSAAATEQPWLLVASQISPDQRQLELRDLQPESWYSVWVQAESVAGKSEAQYTFMTLDKFGRLPLEALEMGTNPGMAASGGMNALFSRYGNGSLVRSLLYNFSSSSSMNNLSGAVSPMLMSACLALILFATCSLFLIRRYNSQQQQHHHNYHPSAGGIGGSIKDNGSIDSDGRACSLASSHYHHPNHSLNLRQSHCTSQVANNHHTTTTAQVIPGHEHMSAGLVYGNTTAAAAGGGAATTTKTSQMMRIDGSDYGHLGGTINATTGGGNLSASPCRTSTTILTGSNASNGSSSTQGVHSLSSGMSSFRPPSQPQLDLSRFMGDVAAAAAATNPGGYIQPTQFNSSTLAHHQHHYNNHHHHQQQQQCEQLPKLANLPADDLSMRFKTMPHQQRASCNLDYCNSTDQQQQQQIYSKLRLLQYNNYYQQPEQQQQQQPLYDANTINLAVLSQQQKMLTCKRQQQQQQANCAAACNLQSDSQQLECPANQEVQPTHDSYGVPIAQYTTGCGGAPAAVAEIGNGYGTAYGHHLGVGGGGSSSIVSGSTSTNTTTNHSSSLVGGGGSAACDQQQQQQQQEQALISLTNEVNGIGNQCSKSLASAGQSNKINQLNGCMNLHQPNQNNNNTNNSNNNTSNEQTSSDYALPFPPKWV